MLPGQWRDGVGGSLPAGEWQGLTRGSIYKIDVVLSASPGYCGNHIPIFTENTTASATYQLQEELSRIYYIHLVFINISAN